MESIMDIVHFLSSPECLGRRSGTEGSARARAFLCGLLNSIGAAAPDGNSYETPLYQSVSEAYAVNISGILPGKGKAASEIILLEAHYDHLGADPDHDSYFPGANDNAAAVAVILHAAEQYQNLICNRDEARSLMIAFFDAEEPPFFNSPDMGAERFCENPVVPLDTIRLGLFLDLLGHPSIDCAALKKGIYAAGAEKSRIGSILDQRSNSGDFRFHRLGIHAIPPSGNYLAFKSRHKAFLFLTEGRSRYYHSTNDSAEKLDYPKLIHTAGHLAAFLDDLNEAPTSLFDYDDRGQDDKATVDTLLRITQCLGNGDAEQAGTALRQASETIATHGSLNETDRSKLSYILGILEQSMAMESPAGDPR